MNIVNKEIFVTGASGFIGTELTKTLLKRNKSFVSISRKKINIDIKNSLIVNNYEIIEPSAGASIIHLAEPNIISEINQMDDYELKKIINLTKQLLKKNWGHFIYISSVVLYDDNKDHSLSTSDEVVIRDNYTKLKATCEKMVIDYGGTVLRLSNVYGPQMSSKNVFSDIFKQLDSNNSVYINNLMSIRDYIWVSDVINAIICSEEKKLNEIFNVGTGVSTSVEGLLNLILKISNKYNVEILSDERNSTKSTIKLDIEKTKKMLCWTPQVSLKSGLKKLLIENKK